MFWAFEFFVAIISQFHPIVCPIFQKCFTVGIFVLRPIIRDKLEKLIDRNASFIEIKIDNVTRIDSLVFNYVFILPIADEKKRMGNSLVNRCLLLTACVDEVHGMN